MPPALADDGSRYWQAMTLSHNFPWYLLKHRLQVEGLEFAETTAIAWESTLRAVLENNAPRSIIALLIVAPDLETGHWSLRRVSEVWGAAPQETRDNGPLLFRVKESPSLLNSRLKPVTNPGTHRDLLARFG